MVWEGQHRHGASVQSPPSASTKPPERDAGFTRLVPSGAPAPAQQLPERLCPAPARRPSSQTGLTHRDACQEGRGGVPELPGEIFLTFGPIILTLSKYQFLRPTTLLK